MKQRSMPEENDPKKGGAREKIQRKGSEAENKTKERTGNKNKQAKTQTTQKQSKVSNEE